MTEFAGLVTAPGLLQRNPASCVDVVNWEFPAPGVVRKRRGFGRLPGNAGGPVWKLFTSQLMGDNLLAHIGTGSSGTQLRYGDGSVALTALTTVDGGNLTRTVDLATPGNRMQVALCQRNQYCTADEGVARLESDLGLSVVRYAGMPRGQGIFLRAIRPTGNAIADGYARAYRVTWHRKDADGVELGGAPTARFVVANRNYMTGYTPATAGLAEIYLQIPWEFGTIATSLSTSYYFRLWGTRTYAEATELGNDEMYLVTEQYLTAPDIANGYFLYNDNTPDSFLLSSPTLHTNLYNFPPQDAGALQGVANEDAPPPVANDVAYWQDCMWYADYAYRPRATLALISNFADGDTVTFQIGASTLTLTAKTVVGAVTDFQIIPGTPSTAIDLRETVQQMLKVLNIRSKATSLGMTGHLIGTSSTLPGLFMVEASRPDSVSSHLTVTTSVAAKFQTSFGYVLGGNASTNAAANGLVFSKPYRADAVPPINQMFAGPVDATIMRVVPYRDRLLVFTDYGIFQVTGRSFADFSIAPFDLGYRLLARECVSLCDQKVYAWCYEGIVEIDDGGVRVVSQSIEPTIEALTVQAANGPGSDALARGRKVLEELAFSTAYRNAHQVRFHYPQGNDATNLRGCAYWLGYDTRTKTWTKGQFTTITIGTGGWLDSRSCAVVRMSDDILHCGNWSSGADTYLFNEHHKYDSADFTDTARDDTSEGVYSLMTFQYQVPIQEGSVHWQQTLWNWDAGEISWRTIPSLVTIIYGADEGLTDVITVAPTTLDTRTEAPLEVRRSQRLSITLLHAETEYAGIVGVSQSFRPGSKFARRVTP